MPIHDHLIDKLDKATFSPDYKESVFMIWYRSGKVNLTTLYGIVPVDAEGRKPSRLTLGKWVTEFAPRADELDDVVKNELDNRLVKEKIEMLNRHADIALEIQERALSYLRSDQSDLNAASAARLLVEGIRIEKESRGIPKLLSKMAAMTDDDLLKEAEKLLLRSPITEMEIIEDENTDELPDM